MTKHLWGIAAIVALIATVYFGVRIWFGAQLMPSLNNLSFILGTPSGQGFVIGAWITIMSYVIWRQKRRG